jgi:hypothetical protein
VEWIGPTGATELGNTPGNEVVLMQYTGLKDKNGREIYEGEIYCHKNVYNCIVQQVKWMPKQAGFNIDSRYIDETEVIGNIYENPGAAGGGAMKTTVIPGPPLTDEEAIISTLAPWHWHYADEPPREIPHDEPLTAEDLL